MKITKKEIKKFIDGVRNTKKNMNWRIWQVGAYIKNEKIHLYAAYHGQGIDENIYNGTYEELIIFSEIIDNEQEYNQQEATNIIYEDIQEMIEEYEENNSLNNTLTFSEATEKWELGTSTLRKSQQDGRFKKGEIRKSGGTWLVTCEAMKRLYGELEK